MQTKEQKLEPLPEYDSASIYPNKKALSSSQFLSYEEDPQKFYIENCLGAKRERSQAMDIGSIFSAAYAKRTFPYREHLALVGCTPKFINLFHEALSKFPVQKNGHPELPMWVEFKGWKFRASLDDYIASSMFVIENKTGKMPWTQERVNFADQLTFQAWVHWKVHGVPPRRILLNWWDTGKTSAPIVHSFFTSRSVQALKQFEKRVELVIENLEAENFTKALY